MEIGGSIVTHAVMSVPPKKRRLKLARHGTKPIGANDVAAQ